MTERLIGLVRCVQSVWQFRIKYAAPVVDLTGKVAVVTGKCVVLQRQGYFWGHDTCDASKRS